MEPEARASVARRLGVHESAQRTESACRPGIGSPVEAHHQTASPPFRQDVAGRGEEAPQEPPRLLVVPVTVGSREAVV